MLKHKWGAKSPFLCLSLLSYGVSRVGPSPSRLCVCDQVGSGFDYENSGDYEGVGSTRFLVVVVVLIIIDC